MDPVDLEEKIKRALLIGTYQGGTEKTVCEEQLQELKSLGDTYGIETVKILPTPLRQVDAGTFLGKGKVQEIFELIQAEKIDLVVFDDEISPQQQRNLEKAFQKPVIDRAELILGVFAQRAQTKEAKVQIELAASKYQLPRLTRLWTHLSRQKTGGGGKGGFLKGEGEKQIEIDRRILKRKIDQLQKELIELRKNRQLHRKAREKSGIPTFAIIGYTNVGKSTLLKALTNAEVLVEDKLFATLDTTTRHFRLPNHQEILLIDTVGFIRKLPHLLVAAFRSTLEEAVYADILLHLVDASNPHSIAQARTTIDVLKELGAEKKPIITVLNKVDQCSSRLPLEKMKILYPKPVEISALNKAGFDRLLERMEEEISKLRKRVSLRIPQSEYALVGLLQKEGKVLIIDYEENDILLTIEIPLYLEKKVASYEIS